MHSFGMIQIKMTDPRSLVSQCINLSNESLSGVNWLVSFMRHYPSDLGSLILINLTNESLSRVHWLVPLMHQYPSDLGFLILINLTNESLSRVNLLVSLMHHYPSDLASLIVIPITPKERILTVQSDTCTSNTPVLQQHHHVWKEKMKMVALSCACSCTSSL